MAKLIYSVLTSLDGYVADKSGNFDRAAPDEEVHTFVARARRPAGPRCRSFANGAVHAGYRFAP